MKIVFSQKLIKKEKLSPADIKEIIKNTSKGIFTFIKGIALPRNSQLIKIYSTTIGGARRIVLLVETASGDSFFLFYRSKSDKIGANISIKNPEFKEVLQSYLMILKEDVRNGNFLAFEAKN